MTTTTTPPSDRVDRVDVSAKPRRVRSGSVIGSTGLYLATGIAALLFLIPFYLIVRNALMTDPEITGEEWKWFPTDIQWGNVSEPFDDPSVDFARSLWNSAVVGVLHTVGTLLFCSLAGYGLARIPYQHANKVFYMVLGTLMVPTAVTFVPSFVLVSSSAGSTPTGVSSFRASSVVSPASCSGSTSWGSPRSWRRRHAWTGSVTWAPTGGSSYPTR